MKRGAKNSGEKPLISVHEIVEQFSWTFSLSLIVQRSLTKWFSPAPYQDHPCGIFAPHAATSGAFWKGIKPILSIF